MVSQSFFVVLYPEKLSDMSEITQSGNPTFTIRNWVSIFTPGAEGLRPAISEHRRLYRREKRHNRFLALGPTSLDYSFDRSGRSVSDVTLAREFSPK